MSRLWLASGAMVLAVLVAAAVARAHRGHPPKALPGGATPVFVEVFSSEGCRSCPPADAWLESLDREQPIAGVAVVALEQHVTYRDRLGWRDPFGRENAEARQRAYAAVLPEHRMVTPEVVIDGHAVVHGGDEDEARREMLESAAEPRARVGLTRSGWHVTTDVTDVPAGERDDPAEVWVGLTESGLTSDVDDGENRGKQLHHAPVVRSLVRVGTVDGDHFQGDVDLETESSWAPNALRVVAFVQLAKSRRILGGNAL
jgi:hypothetical protein